MRAEKLKLKIVNITDFGLFLALTPHFNIMIYQPVKNRDQVYSIGDFVEGYISRIDKRRNRVNFSFNYPK